MPKITAPNIAEHVARQEQRVFGAAIALFIEKGYANVTLGDIATEVGLARNSLYRYYPSKADILLVWFRTELDRQITQATVGLAGNQAPLERIQRWADVQLDYASRPEHLLAATIPQIEPALGPEVRAELAASHDRLMNPLRAALVDAGVDATILDPTVELISGLVLAAARYEATNHAPDAALRDQLHRALRSLIT